MKRSLLASCALLLSFPGHAAELTTVEEIDACMEANRPGKSSIQTIVIQTQDRVGNKNDMDAMVYWEAGAEQESKVLARWDAPPDLRGAAVLMLEKSGRNDMFMYLPELGKTRRITQHMMSGSMLGMDFSYEDFERLQGMAEDAQSRREEDAEVEGRRTYVITRIPGGDSEYERVVTYVDVETCVPLKGEFYERDDEMRKLMTTPFAEVTKESAGYVPRRVRMQDLVEGTETLIRVERLELDAEIDRKYFSQSHLDRIGR